MKRALRFVAVALPALFAAAAPLQAATLIWDTNTGANITTGSGTWDFNTTAAWSASSAGSNPLLTWTNNGDTAQFVAPAAAIAINVSDAGVGASGLVFSKGGTGALTFNRTGSSPSPLPLQIGSGGITSTDLGSFVTFSTPIALTSSQTWTSAVLSVNTGNAGAFKFGDISSASGTTNLILDGANRSNPSILGSTLSRVGFALQGTNTYVGTTTVQGGAELYLNYVANPDKKLDNTHGLVLAGGSIVMNSNVAAVTETVASTTIAAGLNNIFTSSSDAHGAMTLALGAITHTAGGGGVFDISNASGMPTVTTSSSNTSGILGGWATIGSGANSGWLAVGPVTATVLTALPAGSYTTTASGTWTGASNVDITSAQSVAADKTINSLRLNILNSGLGGTLTLNSGVTLTMSSGGILVNRLNNVVTGGTLTTGLASGELFVHTPSALAISSVIADNGGTPTTLVKAGISSLTLTGANTYTGGTIVDSGALNIQGASKLLGTVKEFGGATIAVSAGGTLAPGTALAPVGTMDLGGNLTLEDGAVLNFQLGTISDLLTMNNSFATLQGSTTAGGITLNLSDAGGFSAGTYTLLQWQSGATVTSFDLTDFTVTGLSGSLQFGVNSLQFVSSVPEPTTWAMLILGGVVSVASIRRRHRGVL